MNPRTLGLGLITIGALLEAGVPAAQAITAAGGRLPKGEAQQALKGAADGVRDGRSPAEALAEALPNLKGLRDGPGLPNRLRAAGEDQLHLWSTQRRLAVAARYPVAVAVALVVVSAVITWARDQLPDFGLKGAGLMACGVGVGLAVLLLGWTVARRERGPKWTSLLPGGGLWQLSGAARFARHYACHRDPKRGDMGSHESLQIAPETSLHTALLTQLSAPQAAELLLGEAAHRPAAAAEGLAARLEFEADEAAHRLVAATSLGLLLVVALGVLLLSMGVYTGIFQLVGSL